MQNIIIKCIKYFTLLFLLIHIMKVQATELDIQITMPQHEFLDTEQMKLIEKYCENEIFDTLISGIKNNSTVEFQNYTINLLCKINARIKKRKIFTNIPEYKQLSLLVLFKDKVSTNQPIKKSREICHKSDCGSFIIDLEKPEKVKEILCFSVLSHMQQISTVLDRSELEAKYKMVITPIVNFIEKENETHEEKLLSVKIQYDIMAK